MDGLGQTLNARAAALCRSVCDQQHWLDVEVHPIGNVRVLDFASQRRGRLAAGIWLARICLTDLADVQISPGGVLGLPQVNVRTDHPLWACLAGQYAGWPFTSGDYFAMGSGPARMARGEESLLDEYGWHQPAEEVVGVFEANEVPDASAVEVFLKDCSAERGFFCLARTASLPGSIQVVARSVETTLHKLHELQFDLRRVKQAIGSAPLPPVGENDLESLGWTNDAILYGADVTLWIDAPRAELETLAETVPSASSSQFGRPFLELFEAHGRDFYQVDRMLFSPARVRLQSLQDGSVVVGGEIREDILSRSFRLQ